MAPGLLAMAASLESVASDMDLAKASQNPVGNMTSMPFQNNTTFGLGPDDAFSNVLNLQPVVPLSLSDDWNLINRAIVPLIHREEVFPGTGSASGLGDISYTGYISPAHPGGVIWGIGPSLVLPSATDEQFASDKFSLGAGAVVLMMPGKWVVGLLVQNVWSVAGDNDASDVNEMLLQPIINYNMNNGWYLSSVPVITANWEADADSRWTVPLGGGIGKLMKWGKRPVDVSVHGYYNVVSPDPLAGQSINLTNQGGNWTLRLQLKLLFPK
jgi:hypothetical protein